MSAEQHPAGAASAPSRRLDRWRWRLLVLEAMLRLALAAALLRLLPFRHVASLLIGIPEPPGPAEPTARPMPPIAWRIGRAVGRAARALPFPAACLPQAIAAKGMLSGRGHAAVLHLSARMRDMPAAHAWLTLDGQPVVGHGAPQGQVEVTRFR